MNRVSFQPRRDDPNHLMTHAWKMKKLKSEPDPMFGRQLNQTKQVRQIAAKHHQLRPTSTYSHIIGTKNISKQTCCLHKEQKIQSRT